MTDLDRVLALQREIRNRFFDDSEDYPGGAALGLADAVAEEVLIRLERAGRQAVEAARPRGDPRP